MVSAEQRLGLTALSTILLLLTTLLALLLVSFTVPIFATVLLRMKVIVIHAVGLRGQRSTLRITGTGRFQDNFPYSVDVDNILGDATTTSGVSLRGRAMGRANGLERGDGACRPGTVSGVATMIAVAAVRDQSSVFVGRG